MRNLGIDILKSIAIFLVIYGHILQYGIGGGNPPDTLIFRIIYSFHMPLFMIISGYFSHSTLTMPFRELILKKGVHLLYPWAAGCVVVAFFSFTAKDFNLRWLLWHFWFLRSLFLCFVIAKLSIIVSKHNFFLFCVIGVIISRIYETCDLPTMYISFLLGLFISRMSLLKRSAVLLIILPILYSSIFCCFEYYGYNRPMARTFVGWLSNVDYATDYFREAAWLVMSNSMALFLLIVFASLCVNRKVRLFGKIGRRTLELYVLQVIFIETVYYLFFMDIPIWEITEYNSPFLALFVLILLYFLEVVIEQSPKTYKLLFGRLPNDLVLNLE